MAIAFVRAVPASGTLGANAKTITAAFDATGCNALVVGFSYGSGPGGSNVTGRSVTVQTYAGATMTTLEAWVINAGSTSCGTGLVGILTPTTGSNNIIVTFDADGSGGASLDRLTLVAAGYSGVASFGNVGTNNPAGTSSTSPNCTVSSATGNLVVGIGAHGDSISGASGSTTLRGVANNYNVDTAGGCMAIGDIAGAASVNIAFASSISDHWLLHAVELVASGASFIARPNQLQQPARMRAANW